MISLLLIFILGLCAGSFINALVWRLHEQRRMKKLSKELSVLKGRSMCPHCRHRLAGRDLVPVFSWLSLRGRCRYCRHPVSWRYPVVEASTAALFVLSYAAWPQPIAGFVIFEFVAWLLLLSVLVALAVYDLQYMLLPNKLVAAAGIIVAAYALGHVLLLDGRLGFLAGAALGSAAFGGLFYLLYQVSDGRWIGGGDVKLGFVLGAWLGSAVLSLLSIFIASLIGSLIVAVLLALKKVSLKSRLPFGPLLIAATIIVTLYGEKLLSAYYNFLVAV